MKNEERFDEESVTFVGEQDGEVERELKAAFVAELEAFPLVRRAYLAVVRYGTSEDLNVALCLFGSPDNARIVEACTSRFQEMFNPNQHLDALFLNAEQDHKLARVCNPFFTR